MITKEPGGCTRWHTDTPALSAVSGGSIVTILYSSPFSDAISSGTDAAITRSKASASVPGTPYHVLGEPQCM